MGARICRTRILLVLLASACFYVAAAPAQATGPDVYWGAWIKYGSAEAPFDMTVTTTFESHAGKGMSLIHWASPFNDGPYDWCGGYCSFQTSYFNAARSHGSIPFFSWSPLPGGSGYTDAAVAAGSQDAYITSWARAAAAWGHPFFLRFAWEMNGNWFPWGVGNSGTTTSDYKAMWHHVHDIFVAQGATNATWVWCPNAEFSGSADLASLYPGDSYVDWTCIDGYNSGSPWVSFASLIGPTYDKLSTIAPSKPVAIGEFASTESGGSKAAWITDMFAALPTRFPAVKALLWFDKPESFQGHSDWQIESSSTAQLAFASGIQSSSYASNLFGTIPTTLIAPLTSLTGGTTTGGTTTGGTTTGGTTTGGTTTGGTTSDPGTTTPPPTTTKKPKRRASLRRAIATWHGHRARRAQRCYRNKARRRASVPKASRRTACRSRALTRKARKPAA
jgi:hypothetical protein